MENIRFTSGQVFEVKKFICFKWSGV